MYPDNETRISQEHLAAVFSKMKDPVCLLGGWAVYLTVNERFSQANGRDYLGSRDIDLGFHVDPKWSSSELQSSALAQSVQILKDRGFVGLGFRLAKYYEMDTMKEITEEQAKKKPHYEIFQLYVDPMSDNPHPAAREVLGFPLLDERLLSHVFEGGRAVLLSSFGGTFRLPAPEILVSTKLKSAPDRTKDDKRIKDICDIYALLWYSGKTLPELKKEVTTILGRKKISDSISKFADEDYTQAAAATGINKDEIGRVIGELAR